MKRFFIAVVAVFAASFAFSAHAQMLLPNDETVRVGKLDNGLTYYIKHNDKPAQRAEFYLATHVGAIQETPDQDGLAHFLEHMCFNGTKNFPGKMLLEYLQSIGANFGYNINAATGVEQTTYMLNNIPVVREGIIDTCLMVIHDYSHFVTNDPAEIDAERGVIVEERRSRRTADWRMHEQELPYLYGDSKYATCTLIGSEENLLNFKPESLWNFYKTWYRPDLQAVIVVGDIDVDAIEQKIKDMWSDVPAPETPLNKVMPSIPANAEPLVGIITDPEATSTSVTIVSRYDAMPSEYNAYDIGMTMDLMKELIYSMFSERYNDIAMQADAPFINAISANTGLTELCEAFYSQITCKDGDALNAFKAVMTEVEKAKRFGFTEGELERAKAKLLSRYERAAESADTRENADFVDSYINNFFFHYPYMDPKVEYELVQAILGQIDVTMMTQLASEFITEDNLSIIYKAPEKAGLVHPTAQEFLDVMAAVKASEIQPNEDVVMNEPLLDASSLKGSKVKKTEEGVFGTTVWTLKNGIQVVVRPSSENKDQIVLRLETEGGLSLVPDEETGSMNVYSGLYAGDQGLSKFSATDLRKVLAGKSVNVTPFIGSREAGITGTSTRKDFETAMQLMYLYCVEPRFSQDEYNAVVNRYLPIFENMVNQPNFKLQKRFTELAYGENPRVHTLSPELVKSGDLSVMEKNYRMLFSNFKGAKLYIFGDVDIDAIKPLVEKYAGSLPVEKKPVETIERNLDIHPGTIEEYYEVDMETPMSTALLVWSGDMPYSTKDMTVMRYLSNCLDILYTKTIREEEGGTYGVSTIGDLYKEPKEEFILQIIWQMNPDMTEKLVNKVIDGFKDIAENGPTEEQYNMSKENFLKEISEDRLSNYWWMSQTKFMMDHGIDQATNEAEMIESVTREDIRDLAKKIISQPNFIELVMIPAAAEAQAEAVEAEVPQAA